MIIRRSTLFNPDLRCCPRGRKKWCATATDQLIKLGIKLVMNNRVTEVKHNAVVLKDGPVIASRTILWCAGVKPAPLAAFCGVAVDKSGRIPVDNYLRVQGHQNIFALGDSALCIGSDGKPLPPLGQVAFQQGDQMAANLARLVMQRADSNRSAISTSARSSPSASITPRWISSASNSPASSAGSSGERSIS